jgi:hypothetical protein
MSRKKWLLRMAPLVLLAMTVFIGVGGWVVMSLWNWLAPALFGFRAITFWQALGLLVLCRILFGGRGMHGGHSRSDARKRIRERLAERWEKMTPEERERYRQSWRGRWCPPSDTTPSD